MRTKGREKYIKKILREVKKQLQRGAAAPQLLFLISYLQYGGEPFVGESTMSKDLNLMTIVRVKSYTNIDVRFEDGVVVKKQSYGDFLLGAIKHPTLHQNTCLSNHFGEMNETVHNCMASIIRYRGERDVDIWVLKGFRQLNFGQLGHRSMVINKTFQTFESGRIHEGAIIPQKCGLTAMCTGKAKNGNLNVVFEDGITKNGVSLDRFLCGCVPHPMLPNHTRRNNSNYNGFVVQKRAFEMNDGETYYHCITPWGETDVMTPRQMIGANK